MIVVLAVGNRYGSGGSHSDNDEVRIMWVYPFPSFLSFPSLGLSGLICSGGFRVRLDCFPLIFRFGLVCLDCPVAKASTAPGLDWI